MDATLSQVRAFLTVARLKSFTSAARVLHISQPALTVKVQQLEETLQLRLLDRDTHRVCLTLAGRELLPRLDRILSEFETVVANARDFSVTGRGTVRLACLPSIAATKLPCSIARFRKKYPRVSFDLRDTKRGTAVALVRSSEVEIGVTNLNKKWSDLQAIQLYEERMYVVIPKSHPIARFKVVTLEQVAKCPLLLLDMGLNSRAVLDAEFAAMGQPLKPVCQAKYGSTIIGMVRSGLGVALLPSFTMRASRVDTYPELVTRVIDNPNLTVSIGLIYRREGSLSPPAQAFADLLIEMAQGDFWEVDFDAPESRTNQMSMPQETEKLPTV